MRVFRSISTSDLRADSSTKAESMSIRTVRVIGSYRDVDERDYADRHEARHEPRGGHEVLQLVYETRPGEYVNVITGRHSEPRADFTVHKRVKCAIDPPTKRYREDPATATGKISMLARDLRDEAVRAADAKHDAKVFESRLLALEKHSEQGRQQSRPGEASAYRADGLPKQYGREEGSYDRGERWSGQDGGRGYPNRVVDRRYDDRGGRQDRDGDRKDGGSGYLDRSRDDARYNDRGDWRHSDGERNSGGRGYPDRSRDEARYNDRGDRRHRDTCFTGI